MIQLSPMIRSWREAAAMILAAAPLAGCGSKASTPVAVASPAAIDQVAAAPASSAALDLDGKPIEPLAAISAAATVLIFVTDDCPISNQYVPEITRLRAAYLKNGVAFWMVHADPAETPDEIRAHDKEYSSPTTAIRDPEHHLVDLAHAEVTPTAAVFLPGGRMVYCGRIDDRVTGLGKERPEAQHRDLADALDAVLAGRAPAPATGKPYGCVIPGLQKTP